jgi:hypothetical protein
VTQVVCEFKPRDYQRKLVNYFRGAGKKAMCIWHRKAGKDRVATFIESELACERPGLYWHALPKYEDARKVIWDAIMPDGQRLIDWAFPPSICKRLEHEMKVTLPNGSIWQPVGADNFDSLVGAFPVHVTYSEFPIMSPMARDYLRPALAMNNGTELIIGTPRGYNHAHDLWQHAKKSPEWYTDTQTWRDTGVFTDAAIAEERATMPEELFRQEYECDWSAANVGSILGRYVEVAEKEGRIGALEYDPNGAPLEISSDIGRRHISAWWFWQPQIGGFHLVDYDEDAGLDAEEWIERLKERIGTRKLARIWLPHDARAKTFAAQHSAIEQFLAGFGHDRVAIVPQTKKLHSISAAQMVIGKCRFHSEKCARGLAALRSWAYEYDHERKQYSREPVQDWSTDAADAFCEGAKVMQERIVTLPDKSKEPRILAAGSQNEYTMNDAWADHARHVSRRNRI